ncbi:MAG TPA: DUF2059 domain-containing protein [Xanthobacteraceae bacterium]|nr:DUF2059 domain-containing protein [Xanthobacteraceae bacterium]
MFRSTFAAGLRMLTLLIALGGFGTAAMAQGSTTSANVQLARDGVVASGATRAFEGVVPSILQQSLNVFVQQNPDLQKDLVESLKAIGPGFEKRTSEIIDIIAGVYATRFTQQELKELLTFYQSAVGKKFVTLLPNVLEESFVKTQEWGGKLSEEIVRTLRAEMKKRGHAI